MKRDIEEIADLLARVRHFYSTVGRGPAWLHGLALQMQTHCEGIQNEIGFAATVESSDDPERERMAAESAQRLDRLLDQLGGALFGAKAHKTAHELAQGVARYREAHAAGPRSSKGKRGKVELRKKAVAEYAQLKGKVSERKFAMQFALKHHLSEDTVREWLRGRRGA